jgi:hypothetical protein
METHAVQIADAARDMDPPFFHRCPGSFEPPDFVPAHA